MESKKNSTLGIVALVLSILGCTSLIGVILGIIDLNQKDGKNKTCAKIAVIVGGIFLALGLIISATGSSDKKEDKKEAVEETVSIPDVEPVEVTTPVPTQEVVVEEEPEDDVPMGHKNALRKAGEYLRFTAFSYKGLVEQLEYEGFTNEEAIYGADNCGADWNEQAAAKAKEYIDFSSFSRDGLIEQLKYEGFSHEEAEYGATAIGY